MFSFCSNSNKCKLLIQAFEYREFSCMIVQFKAQSRFNLLVFFHVRSWSLKNYFVSEIPRADLTQNVIMF